MICKLKPWTTKFWIKTNLVSSLIDNIFWLVDISLIFDVTYCLYRSSILLHNARVSRIYKDDGNVNDENNYRPISVIGHMAKMVESLVSYQIIDFLESHSFISMDQSAYLKRHSTQTCLHRVIDDWLEHINDGEITGACLLDISKCFDSINHILLLKKLEMYGIIGTELDWFSSYLNGRKQFVKFNNETSESCEITSGVPQG